jgi:hypothetical protein
MNQKQDFKLLIAAISQIEEGVKGLNGAIFSFILLNSHVMRPHKTISKDLLESNLPPKFHETEKTTFG